MSRVPSTTPPEGALIPVRHPLSPATGTQIPSHFKHCFGCGELHPTGLHLVAHVGDGADITAEFTVTENHQELQGWHTGVYFRSPLMRRSENSCGFCAHLQSRLV